MKHIWLFILVFLINISWGTCQEIKLELYKFTTKELASGKYSFGLMKNKLIPRKTKRITQINENVKIQVIKLKDEHNIPEINLVKSGSIEFFISYKDSIVHLKPIENSFAPQIRIDLMSTSAYLNDQHLCMIKKIKVTDDKNGFNSAWEGFQWRALLPKSSSALNPRITLGKLNSNGKLYLEIIWLERGKQIHYRLLN